MSKTADPTNLNTKKPRAKRTNYSKKSQDNNIDKTSIQWLKYKDIALEFIKSGYNNIRGIYSKYYPNSSIESVDCEAYRLLDNVRFQKALEEAWQDLKLEDLNIAREVILVLRDKMFKSKKDADSITAASWLGRSEAMFTDKSEVKTQEVISDDKLTDDELQALALKRCRN